MLFVVKYGSKMRLRFSAEMPPPVSVKLMMTCVASRSVRMRKNAAALHRFEAVLDHVVKSLLHLIAIQLDQRQIGTQFLLDHDVAVLDLRREKTHRFFDDRVHIFRMKLRLRRPDRAREIGVTIESSRLISDRAMSIDSCSSFVCVPFSSRTFRSINCRWMWSELSGLPIS